MSLSKLTEYAESIVVGVNTMHDKEYTAFIWNEHSQRYEMCGKPVGTELLCKERVLEKVRNGWLPDYYDPSRIWIGIRTLKIIPGSWAVVAEGSVDL